MGLAQEELTNEEAFTFAVKVEGRQKRKPRLVPNPWSQLDVKMLNAVIAQYAKDSVQTEQSVVEWLVKKRITIAADLLGVGGPNGVPVSQSTLRQLKGWLRQQQVVRGSRKA